MTRPKESRPTSIGAARRTNVVVGLGSTGAGNAAVSGNEPQRESHDVPTDEQFAESMNMFIPNAAGFSKMMG